MFAGDMLDVVHRSAAAGRPWNDWNLVWKQIKDISQARKSRRKKAEQRLFRDVFTVIRIYRWVVSGTPEAARGKMN